jgi:hypothetical protein
MEESKLQNSAQGVLQALRALRANNAALRKIRDGLVVLNKKGAKNTYDEPAKLGKTKHPNEGYGTLNQFLAETYNMGGMPINNMVYDARTVHNGHTMEYIPGRSQVNPEYHKL